MSIFRVLLNNTSSNSNMISQNPYSTPQAAYAKTSFPVSLHDIEWSTYSELILTSFAGNFPEKDTPLLVLLRCFFIVSE